MYTVEIDTAALDQVATLPVAALPLYAELLELFEVAPWSGDAYNRARPDTSMRASAFGEHDQGLVIYLVLEEQRRVVVLRVLWLD